MPTLLTNWQNYLFELQGKVQEVFSTEHVLLAELSGVGDANSVGRFTRDMDTNREVFSGKRLRVPVVLAEMQAGGFVSENGTWNVPIPQDTTEAWVNLARALQPFDLGVDVERDSLDNSAAQAVAMLTRQARQSLATIENDAMNGAGAKLADIPSATGSGSLVIVVSEPGSTAQPSATSSIWNRLYVGRVIDILTKSNGANPGNGLRRKITSVSRTAGTVTVSTTRRRPTVRPATSRSRPTRASTSPARTATRRPDSRTSLPSPARSRTSTRPRRRSGRAPTAAQATRRSRRCPTRSSTPP
jgi:hypothetical protein